MSRVGRSRKAHHIPDAEDLKKIEYAEDKLKAVVQPTALKIVWANDERYWKKLESGEFELVQVSWLEVSGSIDLSKLKQGEMYALVFDVRKTDGAFGLDGDLYVMAKVDDKSPMWTKARLDQLKDNVAEDVPFKITNDHIKTPALTFEVPSGSQRLSFGLYDVWSGNWKGGLVINRVKIYKHNNTSK